MSLQTLFLVLAASPLYASYIKPGSEGVKCLADYDCPPGTYCYQSGLCAACTNCTVYSRQKAGTACPREPQQCGPCFPGYEAEKFTGAEVHYYCKKVDEEPPKKESLIWIYVSVSGSVIVLLILMIYWLLRLKVMNGIKSELQFCFQPSAPPDRLSQRGGAESEQESWKEKENDPSCSPLVKEKSLSRSNSVPDVQQETHQRATVVRPPDLHFLFPDQPVHNFEFEPPTVGFTNMQANIDDEASPFLSSPANPAITDGQEEGEGDGSDMRMGGPPPYDHGSSRRNTGREGPNVSNSNIETCAINLKINNYFTQNM